MWLGRAVRWCLAPGGRAAMQRLLAVTGGAGFFCGKGLQSGAGQGIRLAGKPAGSGRPGRVAPTWRWLVHALLGGHGVRWPRRWIDGRLLVIALFGSRFVGRLRG